MIAKSLIINLDTRFTRFFLFFRVYLFFFWISIYIGKERKMKISRNRVTGDFWVYHLVGDFWGVFARDFWRVFVNQEVGSFWGFWYIHGYLIRYIFFDNKRSIKDKRKGTVLYKVLFYTF